MHRVQTGSMNYEFFHITAISIIEQATEFNYIFLVQDEDVIDIWGTDDKVRGANDLVHYYELWNQRDINERDIIMLEKGISYR